MHRPDLRPIDQSLLDQLAEQALLRPRLRCNFNFHQERDAVQRFLNVLQPGTYVRPHRHCREAAGEGFECFVVLQGAIGLLVFDADGQIRQSLTLQALGPVRGVELAEGLFHTLVALQPASVLFELKQGPYQPLHDKDFHPAFPLEGTPEALQQEHRWRTLFSISSGSPADE